MEKAVTTVQNAKPRVALVQPPYGPEYIPSLGLGTLSAGVKKAGFDCRTFYWNLRMMRGLPGDDTDRLVSYSVLGQRGLFPVNEWVFAEHVFPDARDRDSSIESYLAQYDALIRRKSTGRWWSKPFGASHPLLSPTLRDFVTRLRDRSQELLNEMVEELAPYDIVGISTTFCQNVPALALAKQLKQRWPEKRILLGGANCEEQMGPILMEKFPFLDHVFSGEVDLALPEFVRRFHLDESVEQTPGIMYRDQEGHVAMGPRAEPLQQLDELPIPDFDDYFSEWERFGSGKEDGVLLPLESSRGCWWGAKQHCTFCGLNGYGMAFRQKSEERFMWELEEIVGRYSPQCVFMTDNIISMEYFGKFMNWAKQEQLGVDLFYETKANLKRKQVAMLAQAGISSIQPGIESFSSKTLELMRKGVSGIQNIALLKYMSENGVVATYKILFGFPGEDPAEYQKMAREFRKLVHLQPPMSLTEIEYHRFSPYHQNPQSFGLQLRPIPKYDALYPFASKEISRLAYYFEREQRPGYPYFAATQKALRKWRDDYFNRPTKRGGGCSLTWLPSRGDVLIRDRRPGFPPADYRLKDHAVSVFHVLDAPTNLQTAVRKSRERGHDREHQAHAATSGSTGIFERLGWSSRGISEETVAFSQAEFEADPSACIEPLVAAGLVYVENDRYVTLPVAEDSQHSLIRERYWNWARAMGDVSQVSRFSKLAAVAALTSTPRKNRVGRLRDSKQGHASP